jgi:hypothetical protein
MIKNEGPRRTTTKQNIDPVGKKYMQATTVFEKNILLCPLIRLK